MAIIKCPECGGDLSNLSKQCIHCGAPIKVCTNCQAVLVGNENQCPNCGCSIFQLQESAQNANFAKLQKPPAALSRFNAESIVTTINNNQPNISQLIFKIFGILSTALLILSMFAPIFFTYILPESWPAALAILPTIILFVLSFCFFSINIILSLAKEPIAYSILQKQLDISGYDVAARIRYELNEGWTECSVFNYNYKKENIAILINSQARKTNIYLKLIKYLIVYLFYLIYELPMAAIGWAFFLFPIVIGIALYPFGLMQLLLSVPFWWIILILWVIALAAYLVALFAALIIFTLICTAIENKIRVQWIRKNMPDQSDIYCSRILKKKKNSKKSN